jgi:ATP synthase F1 complex assembly factor 2
MLKNYSKFLTRPFFAFRFSSQEVPMRLRKNFFKNVELMEVRNSTWDKDTNTQDDKIKSCSQIGEYHYYILLDKKKCKSMYLDEMVIPNKILATAMAKEWAKQKEYINLYSMHLNFYASSGIRISKNDGLRSEIVNELANYILTDQLCYLQKKIVEYIESIEKENIAELTNKIFEFMLTKYGVRLRTSASIYLEDVDHSVNSSNQSNFIKLKETLTSLDPWLVSVLEQTTGITKSICVSLALLENIITPNQAYLISHSEEYYQMKLNGEVEGHHDIASEAILGKLYSGLCFHEMLMI